MMMVCVPIYLSSCVSSEKFCFQLYIRFEMRDGGFEARPRAGGVNSRRLTRWQLRNIDRAANDARAAGDRAVQVHGVVRYLWYPEKQPQQPQEQCGQQRTSAAAGGGEGASSAMPAQLSKRKQRSAARLEVFQRQAAATAAAAAVSDARAGAASAVEAAARRWLARRHVARLRAAVCPRLSRVALWRPLRRRGSGGWTLALQCQRPSEFGW